MSQLKLPYVHMNVDVYIRMYVCRYIHICMYACFIYPHTNLHIDTHMNVCMYEYICARTDRRRSELS